MKNLLAMLRSPHYERIEEAVKIAAERRSDVEYHRYMREYYYEERTKITPNVSAADATEYARLFRKQEEHQEEGVIAERKHSAAKAKLEALRKSAKPLDFGDRFT
jgi:hypothetical protein